MAFQQGLSGLSIASKALDAISNNVSNSGTVGYKQAGAQFADVFAASLSAGSSTQVGIGASVATVAQQFTQGNISTSSSTLDLAVNGQGFFRMSDNGAITYTRNGQFHVDKNGYVVNSSGLRLTGNTYDAKGLPNGVGGDIRLSYGDADPKATTEAGYNVNLDSRSSSPAALTVATLYGTGVPATVGTPLVLTAANNRLTVAVDGEASATVTIPVGSYADSSSLVAALQTAIDQTSLKGRLVASSDSNGVLSLASERGGRLSSLLVGGTAAAGLKIPSGTTVNGSNAVVATLSSASVAPFTIAPMPAAGTTSTLSIAVDGAAAIPVTINAATYPDSTSLVAALQTAVNATALNGKVVVGADADGRITFSSTLAGGQSSMAVTGGVATDLAMPTFTATANSGGFSITDPTSYTSTTSQTVYDSLGNAHTQSLYFVKTAQSNVWDVYTSLDGGFPPEIDPLTGTHTPITISFDSNGVLQTPTSFASSYTVSTGAVQPLNFTVELAGTTQFGNSYGVNQLTQDGYTTGKLSGLTVDADGTIQGNFSNGQSRVMGQVWLATFQNPNGLQSLGGNQWAVTNASGPEQPNAPGTGSLGVVQSAAVEDSNVDLTAELVNMITQQRSYQANAQSIKTQDQILQTLVNLR